MTLTFRRATVDDAPTLARFAVRQGYDLDRWNTWSEEGLRENIAAGDHVHVHIAEWKGKLAGFIHWVEVRTDEGPAGWFVGAIVSKRLLAKRRRGILERLALRFGDHFGRRGRWFHEAGKEDAEGINYARMVLPDMEIDQGPILHFEGDIAVTYAAIEARLEPL